MTFVSITLLFKRIHTMSIQEETQKKKRDVFVHGDSVSETSLQRNYNVYLLHLANNTC